MAQSDNYIEYPTMTRQREDEIQAGKLAKSDDVNAEFNAIVDVFNRLVGLLQGEWGGDTGRIYELVDEAIRVANEAKADVAKAVLKSGDTMEGQLNQPNPPVADANVVNKKYVDDEISNQLAEPKNNITELKRRLDELNATQVKLDNGNFTGKTVDAGMTELFISVSSGKEMLAAAITDKSGIETAADASFKTMTDNIMAIVTFNEGTSGGTATAEDIRRGKTAFARNQFITGTLDILDTGDATATPNAIVAGYSAYVGGKKIYGTLIPYNWGGGNVTDPTYGTDTSDATATSADIVYGKTAYANGVKLYGTLQNSDVKELYAISSEGYTATEPRGYGNVLEDLTDLTKYKKMNGPFAISPDGNFIVSSVWTYEKANADFEINPDTDTLTGKFIESNRMDDEHLIISSTQSGTRKYRYSYEELYLNPSKDIGYMALSKPGFHGDSDLGLLCITQGNDAHFYLYDYSMDSYGLIGANPRFPDEEIGHWKVTLPRNIAGAPAPSNVYTGVFAIITTVANYGGTWVEFIRIMDKWSEKIDVDVKSVELAGQGNSLLGRAHSKFSTNDTYFYTYVPVNNFVSDDGDFCFVAKVDKDGSFAYTIEGKPLKFDTEGIVAISADEGKLFHNVDVYDLSYSDTGIVQITNKKANIVPNSGDYNGSGRALGAVSPDNSLLYMCGARNRGTYSNTDLLIFKIDLQSDTVGQGVQKIGCYSEYGFHLSSDGYFGTIGGVNNNTAKLTRIRAKEDTQNIIGVEYKDMIFIKKDINGLTATTGDVRKDKKFIGTEGYPEVGTAEF